MKFVPADEEPSPYARRELRPKWNISFAVVSTFTDKPPVVEPTFCTDVSVYLTNPEML